MLCPDAHSQRRRCSGGWGGCWRPPHVAIREGQISKAVILLGVLHTAEDGSLPNSCRQPILALELSSGKLFLTYDPPHPSAVLYDLMAEWEQLVRE